VSPVSQRAAASESKRTFEVPYRPLGIRLCNWVGRRLEQCGVHLHRLTEASILNAARREAGLSDFGDEGFLVPLRQLLQSLRDEARLHPVGRWLMRRRLLDVLINRLRMHDDLKRNPEILDVPVRRPLFVTGLPRTGTTLLYNLLSQDPAGRPLTMWEACWLSPPPRAETRNTDPRIKQARRLVKLAYWLAPQLRTVHPLNADGPEEDLTLTLNTLISAGFSMLARLPGYEAWLRQLSLPEKVTAYQDYRRQLQYLQWRCSADHWVLKTPVHLVALDALLNVFPDACVVQTHRDPAKVVPSFCSLIAVFRGMGTDELDLRALGAWGLENCADLLDRAAKARQTTPGNVLDVRYAELICDPIGTVHRIYDHFGYPRSDRMDTRMRQWLTEDGHDRKPPHRYDPEQFGLDRATICEQFGAYCERHGLTGELSRQQDSPFQA
jgi:hypothetical protein